MGCDKDFAEHFLPDRWTVLGIRLPAFKVGHLLLLDRIESPFVTGEDRQIEDFLTAVCICAQSYKDAEKSLWNGPSVSWRMWTLEYAVELHFRRGYLQREGEKLIAMLTLAQAPVPKVYHDAQGKKTHAPLVMILLGDLMSHFGYSEDEVLEMPLMKANYLREKKLMDDQAASWPEPWEGATP